MIIAPFFIFLDGFLIVWLHQGWNVNLIARSVPNFDKMGAAKESEIDADGSDRENEPNFTLTRFFTLFLAGISLPGRNLAGRGFCPASVGLDSGRVPQSEHASTDDFPPKTFSVQAQTSALDPG